MDIYDKIADRVERNPTLHSSRILGSILVSLFNGRKINLWESFSILNPDETQWALEAMLVFSQQGDSEELRQAAWRIMDLESKEQP